MGAVPWEELMFDDMVCEERSDMDGVLASRVMRDWGGPYIHPMVFKYLSRPSTSIKL